jgi:hypothetical protein
MQLKEEQEVKLKGEIYKLLLAHDNQLANETVLQQNGRLIDLTNDVFNIVIKYVR